MSWIALEKLEQKIQAGRRLKRKWESVKKFFRSKMFREALLHAKKEVLYFLKKAAPKKVARQTKSTLSHLKTSPWSGSDLTIRH